MATDQSNWVLVDFEKAEVGPGSKAGSLVLTVTGNTPSSSPSGTEVKLSPVAYVTQPDFWRIEVLWDRAGAIFQSLHPYSVSMPVDGVRGEQGVEVVGRTRSEKVAC
jgi:hypothetical protein